MSLVSSSLSKSLKIRFEPKIKTLVKYLFSFWFGIKFKFDMIIQQH